MNKLPVIVPRVCLPLPCRLGRRPCAGADRRQRQAADCGVSLGMNERANEIAETNPASPRRVVSAVLIVLNAIEGANRTMVSSPQAGTDGGQLC
jgi:hypothetical protein